MADALSVYLSNVNAFWIDYLCVIAAASVGIPFIAGLGEILSDRSTTIARGAVLLVFAAIFLRLVAGTIEVVGLFAVSQGPTGGAYATSAEVQAAFAFHLGAFGAGVAYVMLGFGLVLVGWVSWGSPLFPWWLSILVLVGGIVGLLSPAADFLVAVEALVLVIFPLAIGIRLLLPGKTSAIPSPSEGSSPPSAG